MPTFYLSHQSLTFLVQGTLLLVFALYLVHLPRKSQVIWVSIGYVVCWCFLLYNFFFDASAIPTSGGYLLQKVQLNIWPWSIVFMFLLGYNFPRPTPHFAKERKIAARIAIGIAALFSVLSMVVDTGSLHQLFEALRLWGFVAVVWGTAVLIRRTLFCATQPERSRIRKFLDPATEMAVATRNLVFVYLLYFLWVIAYWLQESDIISNYEQNFLFTLLFTLPLFCFGWVWLNHVPIPTAFMAKVVGIALFSMMTTLSHAGTIVAPAITQAYQPAFHIPNQSRLRFQPTAAGGYTVSPVPYDFRADWGERLAFEQAEPQIVPLPFAYPYFGEQDRSEATSLFIYHAGGILVEQPYRWQHFFAHAQPAIIPFSSSFVREQGEIFLKVDASSLTITWHNMRFAAHPKTGFETAADNGPDPAPESGLGSGNTFQAVLWADGTIDFAYQTIAKPVMYTLDAETGIWMRGVLPGNQTPITSRALAQGVTYIGQPGEALLEDHYRDFRAHLHQQLLPLLYVILAALVVIVWGFPFFLRRTLVNPLKSLVQGMQQVNIEPNLQVDIPIYQKDEIGILTSSFNGMVRSLQQNRQELQQLNTTLEERVQERTDELAQSNYQLIQAKEEADAANLAKSRFLSNASHELRTPLAAVLGYTTLIQRTALSAKQEKWVNNLDNSGKHLLAIINELLDLSKIEADKLTLSPRPVHLPNFLRELVSMMSGLAEQKELELHYEADPDLPTHVLLDVHRLRQVLLNLLANAIKFTEQGHVQLTVIPCQLPSLCSTLLKTWQRTYRVNPQGNASHCPDDGQCDYAEEAQPTCRLHFAVSDSGIGIAPEHQVTIFEPFEQAGVETERSDGTGLGLTICRLIVELMGAEIHLESELGQGSTFWFELDLPLSAADCAEISQDDVGKHMNGIASSATHKREVLHDGGNQVLRPRHFPLRRPQEEMNTEEWAAEQVTKSRHRSEEGVVLVIDDNLDNLNILSDFLRNDGFTVIGTRDGRTGIKQAEVVQPDLILLDILMPAIDGFETCRRLKKNSATREIPVLFMTALTDVESKLHGFAQGAVDYITKPFQEDETLARVRTHVSHRRLMAMAERQRLSRNLHDSVTQSLYSQYLLVERWQTRAAEGQMDGREAIEAFVRLKELSKHAVNESRLLLHQLRDEGIKQIELVSALEQRLNHVEERAGIATHLHITSDLETSDLETLPPHWKEQLYFIAQEALNNVLRHAKATEVTVSLHQTASALNLTIQDNGCGFDLDDSTIGLGLMTMRERSEAIGGQIEISWLKGQGTIVHVLVDNTTNGKL